jgi:hypothetical protein
MLQYGMLQYHTRPHIYFCNLEIVYCLNYSASHSSLHERQGSCTNFVYFRSSVQLKLCSKYWYVSICNNVHVSFIEILFGSTNYANQLITFWMYRQWSLTLKMQPCSQIGASAGFSWASLCWVCWMLLNARAGDQAGQRPCTGRAKLWCHSRLGSRRHKFLWGFGFCCANCLCSFRCTCLVIRTTGVRAMHFWMHWKWTQGMMRSRMGCGTLLPLNNIFEIWASTCSISR